MADQHGSENSRVVRAAGVVGMATMLSRVFGFIRDMIVAGLFGEGLTTDAFFVAFRIPNLLRRLLAEGSLTVSFVPVFTEYLKTRTREEALELDILGTIPFNGIELPVIGCPQITDYPRIK
jgi:putative peptidoglycan lipid II flippase